MGNAYVYVQYITGTCIRAIYIFLMLLRLTVHICIRARYITGICIRAKVYIYILWLIIYYLILLNLTLANPHTELAMARLSSPANTTTIADNITPRVATLQLQGTKTWSCNLTTPGNRNMGIYQRQAHSTPPLDIFIHPPSPPLSLMPHSLGSP